MMSLYVDPTRRIGSQSEQPQLWEEGDVLRFGGYQRFSLSTHGIKVEKHDHVRKYALIRPYLLSGRLSGSSIMDLGCSAGAMGFQAYFDGFSRITFVDHDIEYLRLVSAGINHIGANTLLVEESKAHAVSSTSDVLFAFAIIHWLYSCTEDFGSLDRIVEKLAGNCRKAMFIEWIGPECKDVQTFGHLRHNPELHKDSYSRENFVRALRERFPHVKRVGKVHKGREIWLASHEEYSPSVWLLVRQRSQYWMERAIRKVTRLAGP